MSNITNLKAVETEQKHGVINSTTIQRLVDEVRQVVGNAILHDRVDEVLALMKSINDEPEIPFPTPDLFMASRLIKTEVSESGLRDVAAMVEAIEEADDIKFASYGAALYGSDNLLGAALAAFAFDPDDCVPGLPEACRRAIMDLAVKWRVALPPSPEVAP